MAEPVKHEYDRVKQRWVVSQEWKDWRKQVMSDGFEKHNKSKRKRGVGRHVPIDPENHKPNWKEVAWVSGSEKRILFCYCQSITGMPFSGCGAVGIRHTRAGKVTVVVEPRFE